MPSPEEIERAPVQTVELTTEGQDKPNTLQQRRMGASSSDPSAGADSSDHGNSEPKRQQAQEPARVQAPSTDMRSHGVSIPKGLTIIGIFFGKWPRILISSMLTFAQASFIAILVARGSVHEAPRSLDLFANMYLAGTIIFGGGPVVIPLLREYVVQPGWVSSRDFLIGLAIIQALPGPNFNFAVYLGALAFLHTPHATVLGALLGFVGIFLPGITLAVGAQSIWRVLRKRPLFVSLLRGINATAVGLVFTAVYRLWGIGYLTPEANGGQSLALEPWWVVITVVTYAESAWFRVPPPVAIVLGAVLGLCWYGAVGRK